MVGFCFATCFFISCKDEESDLGLNLQPGGGTNIVFHDSTTTLRAYTYKQSDTLKINAKRTYLGVLNDPRFGQVQYNFFTELVPEIDTMFASTEISPIIDTVMLKLTVDPDPSVYMGNNSGAVVQTVKVYKMKNNILSTINNNVLSSELIDEYKELESSFEFTFNPAEMLDSTITFVLEKGSSEFYDLFYENRTHFNDDSVFRDEVLRGFYFESMDHGVEGGVNALNLTTSSFDVKYHYYKTTVNSDNTTTKDTIYNTHSLSMVPVKDTTWVYQSNSNCNVVIHKHQPNDPITINEFATDPDTSIHDKLIYIKSNNGLEARFNIGDLNHWKDSGNIFINKAVIELKEDFIDANDEVYNANQYLYARLDTMETLTVDAPNYYTEFIAVKYNGIGKGYTIPLTEVIPILIQEGITKLNVTLTTGVTLISSKWSGVGTERVVLCSPNHPDESRKAKLHIVYTKLN